MYLLRDNPVKAPNRAIRERPAAPARRWVVATAWAVVLMGVATDRVPASAAGAAASPARARPRGSSQANLASAGGCPPLPASTSGQSVSCRLNADLTRIFTPASAPRGTYRAFVTSSSIDTLAAQLRTTAPAGPPSWPVQEMDPLEAFGSAGEYDTVAVARLYVGRRARVARGPIVVDGKVITSLWLISPYPDATLARLEPGTLIIEFHVPTPSK